MPTYLIRLDVDDVDVFDEDLIEASADALPLLSWGTSDGTPHVRSLVSGVTATQALDVLLTALRRVAPTAKPKRVLEDWVAIRDIADRASVNRETVRLWANGERQSGFPAPRGTVSRNMRVWDWASVNAWLRDHVNLGDDYETPSPSDVVKMNEQLRFYAYQDMLHSQFEHADRAHSRSKVSSVAPIRWAGQGSHQHEVAREAARMEVRPQQAAV